VVLQNAGRIGLLHPQAKECIYPETAQTGPKSTYSKMKKIIRFVWTATRGHRLAPWRSPYLRWRIETYSGLKMEEVGFFQFWVFLWRERHELARFLQWTATMQDYARPKPRNP
jgi:hypothetical protein